MEHSESPPGQVPEITPTALQQDIQAIEARLRELAAEEATEQVRERARVLEALLRNRHNITELLKAGRFT